MPEVRGKKVTQFYANLVALCAAGVAESYGMSDEHTFFVWAGRYQGMWTVGRHTSYKLFPWGKDNLDDLALKFGYKNWKYLMVSAPSRANNARRIALKVVAKSREAHDKNWAAAEMIANAYGGADALEAYRALHPESKKRIDALLKSTWWKGIGLNKRYHLFMRLLKMREAEAWRKSFPRMHPSVRNTLRQTMSTPGTGFGSHGQLGGLSMRLAIPALNSGLQFVVADLIDLMRRADLREEQIPLTKVRGITSFISRYPLEKDTAMHLLNELERWPRPELNRDLDMDIPARPEIDWARATPDDVRACHHVATEFLAQYNRLLRAANQRQMEQYERERAIREADPDYINNQTERQKTAQAWREMQLKSTKLWEDQISHALGVRKLTTGCTLLSTEFQYVKEGEDMRHCVAGYYKHAQLRGIQDYSKMPEEKNLWYTFLEVYSFQIGKKRGTLALWVNKDHLCGTQQFYGPCNQKIDNVILEAAKELAVLNGWDPEMIESGYGKRFKAPPEYMVNNEVF